MTVRRPQPQVSRRTLRKSAGGGDGPLSQNDLTVFARSGFLGIHHPNILRVLFRLRDDVRSDRLAETVQEARAQALRGQVRVAKLAGAVWPH